MGDVVSKQEARAQQPENRDGARPAGQEPTMPPARPVFPKRPRVEMWLEEGKGQPERVFPPKRDDASEQLPLPKGLVHPVHREPTVRPQAELLKEARDAAASVRLSIDGLRRLPENAVEIRDTAAAAFHAARNKGSDEQWVQYARWLRANRRSEVVGAYEQDAGKAANQYESARALEGGSPADVQKAIALYYTVALRGVLSNAHSEAPNAQDERMLRSIISTPWFKAQSEQHKMKIADNVALINPSADREYRALFTHMLRHPNFELLGPFDQARLIDLAAELKTANIRDLVSLLTTTQPGTKLPVLLNRDFTESPAGADHPPQLGKTLLQNLLYFAQPDTELKTVNGVDFNQERTTLLLEMLQECNRFNLVDQSDNPTCAATTLEHCAAWNNPSELVRISSGLFSGNSSPMTKHGDGLFPLEDAYHADPSGRTRIERVFQSAFMDLGGRKEHGQKWRYDSTANVFFNSEHPAETRDGGLGPAGTAAIFDSFYGIKHQVVINTGTPAKAAAVLDAMIDATKAGEPPRRVILCLDVPPEARDGKVEGHAVMVLGVDHQTKIQERSIVGENRLLFRNPWGATREPNGTIQHGGIRIDDGQHGLCSVKFDDLKHNGQHQVSWSIIQPARSAR